MRIVHRIDNPLFTLVAEMGGCIVFIRLETQVRTVHPTQFVNDVGFIKSLRHLG
jgi:hypothetical protein